MAQVECPRCRGRIDPRSTRCKHCQADFNEADLAAIKAARDGRNTLLALSAGIILLVVAASQCTGGGESAVNTAADLDPASANNEAAAIAATDAALDAAAEAAAPASDWSYSRRYDAVRNGEIVEARLRSTNSVDLDFPYGEVGLTIVVRKHPEWGQDVIFSVDEGQILCGISACSGTMNLDGQTQRLRLNESGDNDSAVVFAADGPGMTAKLKSSKRLVVELPFFQNGNRQFTFVTAGLEWPPRSAAGPSLKGPPAGKDPLCDPEKAASVGASCEG